MADFLAIVRGLRGELRYEIEAAMFGRPTRVVVEACQIAGVRALAPLSAPPKPGS